MYGMFYDSIVAATKKNPEDATYMDPTVANEIITDMREVIKKYIDVDLVSGYSVAEKLSQSEIRELEEEDMLNEELIGALRRLKNKAMDKLFGAEKGSDQRQKTSNTQSRKLQQTRGSGQIKTERGKTLASNKLPQKSEKKFKSYSVDS